MPQTKLHPATKVAGYLLGLNIIILVPCSGYDPINTLPGHIYMAYREDESLVGEYTREEALQKLRVTLIWSSSHGICSNCERLLREREGLPNNS